MPNLTDPHRHPGQSLCTTCAGLRYDHDTDGRGGPPDLCACQPAPDTDNPDERERWLPCHLCQICGLRIAKGHHRWRRVVCEPCFARVKDFNAQMGRKIIPPGIHTLVNAGMYRFDPVLDPAARSAAVGEFIDHLNDMVSAIGQFRLWSRRMLVTRLRSLGWPEGQVIPLEAYLAACDKAGIAVEDGWIQVLSHVLGGQVLGGQAEVDRVG